MSSLLLILSCILFQISLGQVSFTEVASTDIYYPRYKINLGSNPCGLSVCLSCIEIRCNNGVIHASNQIHGDEYAWDYHRETFQPPLTFVMTKSNNDIITFTNLISDYNTSRTFQTGQQFCPTPSPISNPTNNPSITPTKYPTKSLTKTPTKNPSITPNISQTYYPSYLPTNNPTINSANTTAQFTTTNTTAQFTTANTTAQSTTANTTAQSTTANTTAQSTTANNTILSENTTIQSTPTTEPIVNTIIFMEKKESEDEGISASIIIIGVIIFFGVCCIAYYCRVYHQKKIKKEQPMETHIGMNGTKSNSTNGNRSSDTCTPEPVSLEIKQNIQNGNNVVGVINTINMGMTPATYATNNPMGSTFVSTYPTIPGMSKMSTINTIYTDRNALIMNG
eukprot:52333_1